MSVNLSVLSFLISFFACFIIVEVFRVSKSKIMADTDYGPQKFHNKPTSRVGGIAVFLATVISLIVLYFIRKDVDVIYFVIASLPAFLSGFFEDITKKIKPKVRLSMAMLSALVGVFLLSAIVPRVDIGFIDNLLKFNLIAIIFTVFAVSGVTNSMNIIDGYNGLLSMVSAIILIGLAYVSFKVHDPFLMTNCLVLIGAIAGFFVWNYPFGKIFMGDGGAYFIGFSIAELSIMLINRHNNVSAWFPFLLVIYPVFETLFSIYRRKFVKKRSPTQPDSFHLHQLIYERIVPIVYNIKRDNKLSRNSATSPFLWLICSVGVIPAVVFWNNTVALEIAAVIFCIIYIYLYVSIVKFKFGKFFRK